MDELKALEIIAEEGGLSEEERERKRQLCRDLERALLQEEISWRQKSRIKWLKEGGKCTKFFHLMVNSNKRYNTIDSLLINGALSSNPTAIRDHAVNYYEFMFAESMSWRPKLDDLEFESLSAGEASSFEAPFSGKVKDVILGMDGNKAPSPDSFSWAFFQACWEVLKKDIMAIFPDFHVCGRFKKSLNSTFISLIPKVSRTAELKDFHPISLISGIYKIISKVLVNGLRMVMSIIISTPQNALVKGKQILDSVLIANESLNFHLKSREPGLLCKFDMEKAYDHVSWNFL